MAALSQSIAPYFEFSRIGFVNILAFRLRYFTGIITYLVNVTVYYFIWTAVFAPGGSQLASTSAATTGAAAGGVTIAGYGLAELITYVAVGWIIRSFYWNTIDQEMAFTVLEGKIAVELIKPISIQGMWLARAAGESAFRLGMLTAPTALAITFLFPVRGPASATHFLLFVPAVAGSFLLMGAINFMIGTCAVHLKSILALIRAKYWLIELLSGLLIPVAFFPEAIRRVLVWLPFPHIAATPLEIYLGKLSPAESAPALAIQWAWAAGLLLAGHWWWNASARKLTIHGG